MISREKGWSEYYLVSKFMGHEHERTLFLRVWDDLRPDWTATLQEVSWAPVEKHNTNEIASLAQLKRAVSFEQEGSWLTRERIERKRFFVSDSEKFTIVTEVSSVSFEEVEELLSGVPRVSWWRWMWTQLWFRDPFVIRDSAGLVWRRDPTNTARAERRQLFHILIRSLSKVIECPNPILRHAGLQFGFCTWWHTPTTSYTFYGRSGQKPERWDRIARLGRFGLYRKILTKEIDL